MVKKKIFILGSRGQLGNFLLKNLKIDKKKYKILKLPNFNNRVRLINFHKYIQKLKKTNIDLIINCSGYTQVDLAEKQKRICKKLNYECVKKLTNFCKKNLIILIHFSTDYVFNGKNKFYEPSDKCIPANYYGYTKYLGEKEILKLNNNYFIFRISWLLSASKLSFLYKIKEKIKLKKTFDVVSDSISCPTTVIFIKNFIQKNIDTFFNKNKKGIFHLVNPSVLSYFQLAKYIEKLLLHKNCNIIRKIKHSSFKTLAYRPKISKLSIKKTKKYFIIPKNTWKKDVEKFIT
jgi:dTDP-4-dehydrorhamnose reductase